MITTLAGGLLGLIAILGVGTTFTRLLGPVPARWLAAVSMVSGVALIDLAVMLILAFGGGVHSLKIVGACSFAIGCLGLLMSSPGREFAPLPIASKSDVWFAMVIAVVVVLNFIIAAAPSTKMDELHYHMLVPKRVLEDNRLRLYREPYESAIFPQMAFQVGLSVAHAAGFPEAGNLISWGLSTVLILLVTGLAGDLTGSTTAGWMTGAVAAVGLYSSVWHVTSGPHALGDLATLTACLFALLPEEYTAGLRPSMRLVVICVASCTAASTKISLLPLSVVVTIIGALRSTTRIGWWKAAAIAGAVWGALHGPALVWTTIQSGSPLGLATAAMFHSRFFGAETISQLESTRQANQVGVLQFLQGLPPWISVGVVGAFAVIAYAPWTRAWPFKALAGIVAGQTFLIAWLLPHDFRFLGGLQYVVLVMGAWVSCTPRTRAFLKNYWSLVLVSTCLPWLALQVYYAGPFVKVALGLVTREAFVNEYVAYAEDFRALDRILPAKAVIYVPDANVSSYYAPRPVIFTLQDLQERNPLYRLSVGPSANPGRDLFCKETVYENRSAVVKAFRTPWRSPERDRLRVERCVPLPQE